MCTILSQKLCEDLKLLLFPSYIPIWVNITEKTASSKITTNIAFTTLIVVYFPILVVLFSTWKPLKQPIIAIENPKIEL